MTELNLEQFEHTKAIVKGFSLVNYNDVGTMALLSDILQDSKPLNKLPTISVSNIATVYININLTETLLNFTYLF